MRIDGGGDEDKALVERVLGGEPGAFTVLYNRYLPVLSRRLHRVMGVKADLEDVVQTTFARAYERLPSYDTGRSFGAWLWGIAYNVTGDYLRARRRRAWLRMGTREEIELRPDESRATADAAVLERELAALLYRAMEYLSPEKRIAFALHEIEGLNFSEIGALTNASPQTTRARVLSAQAQVKKRLGRLARPHGRRDE